MSYLLHNALVNQYEKRRKQFLPVVVDGMEDGVALDLGGTTRGVVNVVTLESDHVA